MSIRGTAGLAAALVALTVAGFVVEGHRALVPLRFAVRRQPELLPSTRLAPAGEVDRGLPLLSVHVAPHDLYDRTTGILANKTEKGMDWERPASASYFDEGRLMFAESVGVRVHGGGSRFTSPRQSLRLFVRRRYGGSEFPGGVLFGPSHDHPLPRLVVHNDMRRHGGLQWHLINPLAYDIAGAAGCIVSPTRPVRFFLNGEYQGVFVLSEHFHERHFFERHWGRRVSASIDEFDRLWREVLDIRPLRMAAVGRLVDLDSLTRWFIVAAFSATADAYQGPNQYRDGARAEAQWFWVAWDLDGSFRSPDADSFQALLERVAESRRGRRDSEPRPYILTTLLAEDEAYREYFKRVWVEIMNHRITPTFLRERFEHYEDIVRRYGIEDVAYLEHLRRFLDERPAIAWALAEQWLNSPPRVRCRIAGSRRGLLVNGHAAQPGFEGHYFPGMAVEVEVSAEHRGELAYWRVNGRRHDSAVPLRLIADRDLEIEPIWR